MRGLQEMEMSSNQPEGRHGDEPDLERHKKDWFTRRFHLPQ